MFREDQKRKKTPCACR